MNVFVVWLGACLKNVKQLCLKVAGTFCKTKSTEREESSKGAAVGLFTILLVSLCSAVFWVSLQTILQVLGIEVSILP